MKNTVLSFMKKHHMTEPGDRVCVGLSGGADSVCLMVVLAGLREELGISLGAVHVHHGIRGDEADRDLAYVKELCEAYRIPLYLYEFDVPKLAKQWKSGLEETGRLVRHQAFSDCISRHGVNKIALAHHRNDQAETILFQLCRGSSLKGLGGIRPVQGELIRPLLDTERKDIERYLSEKNISWRTDSTNLDSTYSRNLIRSQILPALTEHINAGTLEHMSRAAEDVREAEDYIREQAMRLAPELVKNTEEGILIDQMIREKPAILATYLIMECLGEISGGRKDLAREHVFMVRQLFEKQCGRQISLPGRIFGKRTYEGVLLYREAPGKMIPEALELHPEKIQDYTWGDFTFHCELVPNTGGKIPEKTYTKWLDYDKIRQNLVLRTRHSGDYITVNAAGDTKKLKVYLIQEKVPAWKREAIPLLASGQEIYWVVGLRIGESCKVTADTKQILIITITGGRIHEGNHHHFD